LRVPQAHRVRSPRLPPVLGRLLIVVAGLALSQGCSRGPEGSGPQGRQGAPPGSPQAGLVGKRLFEFRVTPLDDDSKTVGMADLAGKVVLVDLWGTWCGPCGDELPHVAALGKKYGNRGDFRLVTISCGRTAPEEIDDLRQQTKDFLRQTGLELPTYLDPGFVTRQAIIATGNLRSFGFPMTLLFDRQGVIRDVWLGYDNRHPEQIDEIDQAIARLLDEKAA
jgi:thiol-disulfide isomerase/thioredoxin